MRVVLLALLLAGCAGGAETGGSLRATTEALGAYASESSDIGVVLFSALKKTGVDDVTSQLWGWAHP